MQHATFTNTHHYALVDVASDPTKVWLHVDYIDSYPSGSAAHHCPEGNTCSGGFANGNIVGHYQPLLYVDGKLLVECGSTRDYVDPDKEDADFRYFTSFTVEIKS